MHAADFIIRFMPNFSAPPEHVGLSMWCVHSRTVWRSDGQPVDMSVVRRGLRRSVSIGLFIGQTNGLSVGLFVGLSDGQYLRKWWKTTQKTQTVFQIYILSSR